jgi:hypothetical protein
MNYPQLTGEPNVIIIGMAAIFGLAVIIIVYYIVVSKSSSPGRLYAPGLIRQSSKNNTSKPMNSNLPTTTIPQANTGVGYYAPAPPATSATPGTANIPTPTGVSNPNIKQVFNIKENIYALEDAKAVCAVMGAEVATVDQLIEAHKNGADWCNVGWTKDGLAAFPIQYSTWKKLQENEPAKRGICGKPGINLVRNDPNLLYGVNCYGVKPEPKKGEKVKQVLESDADIALKAKMAQLQRNMDAIGVAPWNQDTWSQ